MKAYRQGDVLLRSVDDAAHAADVRRNGRLIPRRHGQGIILASGEATGHHHRMRTRGARRVRLAGAEYLVAPGSGGVVTHEEHDPLEVPGGVYEIVRQREHVPPARGQRKSARREQPVWD